MKPFHTLCSLQIQKTLPGLPHYTNPNCFYNQNQVIDLKVIDFKVIDFTLDNKKDFETIKIYHLTGTATNNGSGTNRRL